MNVPPDTAPQQGQPDNADRGDESAAAAAATPSGPVPSTPAAPILPAQSREDTDVGWGDYGERDDDDRLLRDRPPHWGNS
jgi:hypothetical protein